jgi:Uma2 family endonuclease
MLAEHQHSSDDSSSDPTRVLRGNSTYRDYAALPESTPYELIEGELVMTPSPTPGHQRVAKKISYAFIRHIEGKGLGEVFFAPIDVYLDDHNTVVPDILVLKQGNPARVEAKFIRGTPDFIVEVLSPSNPDNDLTRKKRLYARFGVQEYWIADPVRKNIRAFWNGNQEFELRETGSGQVKIESELFPGLILDTGTIFEIGLTKF